MEPKLVGAVDGPAGAVGRSDVARYRPWHRPQGDRTLVFITQVMGSPARLTLRRSCAPWYTRRWPLQRGRTERLHEGRNLVNAMESGAGVARITISAAIAAILSVSALHAETYSGEAGARACIHKRLTDLLAQDQRQRISDDPTLSACTKDLKTEMATKGKTACEQADYVSWLVANENSRINGMAGSPYQENKSFIRDCQKPKTRKRAPPR
jgi:hypothetical protein